MLQLRLTGLSASAFCLRHSELVPWRKRCKAWWLRTFSARLNVPPLLFSYCSSILAGFLLTFFSWGFFSLVWLQLCPFSEYAPMAPLSNVSPFYYELYDRTFVPGANLKEHKAGAIHRSLLEVSIKMTRRQFQMFWEDLKIGRCKQKLLAKRAIFRLYESHWNPEIGAFLFFSTVFYRVIIIIIVIFRIPKSFGPWSKLHPPIFFPARVGTFAWNKPYIGGPLKALGSSVIFERKGLISPVLWKMLLGSVVRWCKSLEWNNGTWPWTISKSSRRIVSWFTKGPWLLSCYMSLFRPI